MTFTVYKRRHGGVRPSAAAITVSADRKYMWVNKAAMTMLGDVKYGLLVFDKAAGRFGIVQSSEDNALAYSVNLHKGTQRSRVWSGDFAIEARIPAGKYLVQLVKVDNKPTLVAHYDVGGNNGR